jgi:hypothetical protein
VDVVQHPEGVELFMRYLKREIAAESLQFYVAVEKLNHMSATVRKQYAMVSNNTLLYIVFIVVIVVIVVIVLIVGI